MNDFRSRRISPSRHLSVKVSPQRAKTEAFLSPSPHKKLITCADPVHSALNLKAFMQVQRKKMRSLLITRNFELSNNELNMGENTRAGFKGGKVPNKKYSRKNKFIYQERMEEDSDEIEERVQFQPNITSTGPYQASKPNIMVNLTLYRKSFREKCSNEHRHQRKIQSRFLDITKCYRKSKTTETIKV